MNRQPHVVIIGAGPAGLCTALGIARKGLKVTVVDREPDVLPWPRAAVYLPSTLQSMDKLGLLEEMKEEAVMETDYFLHFKLTGNVGRMSYEIVRDLTPYAYVLHFGQDQLGRLLLKHLKTMPNVSVKWNTHFDGLEQTPEGVTVRLRDASGPQLLDADWVVGADGARSGVRAALGLEFEGFTWPETFMATNVLYPFDEYGFAGSNMLADPDNWAVIARTGKDGVWRVAYGEDSNLSETERLARIPERFKSMLPEPRDSYDIRLANSYRVHQRCAPTFRVGRVLLAGDAAHATNPIGGMGFTSGVKDADLLIEALPAVALGDASDEYLDWYAYERRRIFLEIANPTGIEFKRRTQERDTQRRLQDEENFFKMMKNPEMMRAGLMSIFSLNARPYQEDWRETVLKADRERTPEQSKVLLNGAQYTAEITVQD